MFRMFKLIAVPIFSIMLLTCVALLTVKILAYRNAIPGEKYWNESKTCYLITYRPNYKPYGGIGRILNLFSNQSFFAVYNINNEKLKSSAWHFWQYQFSDLVAPEWSGIDVLYPSDQGWSGWTFHECSLVRYNGIN